MAQLCPLGHPSRNRGPFWVAVIHLILHITWCYERVQFMEWFMSGKYIVRQARIGCQQWHILRCLYYLFAWNLSWFILSCCVWLSAYRLMLPRFKHSITVTCNTIGQPALCKTSFRWRNAMLEEILQKFTGNSLLSIRQPARKALLTLCGKYWLFAGILPSASHLFQLKSCLLFGSLHYCSEMPYSPSHSSK